MATKAVESVEFVALVKSLVGWNTQAESVRACLCALALKAYQLRWDETVVKMPAINGRPAVMGKFVWSAGVDASKRDYPATMAKLSKRFGKACKAAGITSNVSRAKATFGLPMDKAKQAAGAAGGNAKASNSNGNAPAGNAPAGDAPADATPVHSDPVDAAFAAAEGLDNDQIDALIQRLLQAKLALLAT